MTRTQQKTCSKQSKQASVRATLKKYHYSIKTISTKVKMLVWLQQFKIEVGVSVSWKNFLASTVGASVCVCAPSDVEE